MSAPRVRAGFRRLPDGRLVLRPRGRPSLVSAAERAEVERLLDAGDSIRAVAEQVFGERRFRGRVERIARQRACEGSRALWNLAADSAEASVSEPAWLAGVFERLLARLGQPEVEASPQELVRLLELWRWLHELESIARLQAATAASRCTAPLSEPVWQSVPAEPGVALASAEELVARIDSADDRWQARTNTAEATSSTLAELRASLELIRRLHTLETFVRAQRRRA